MHQCIRNSFPFSKHAVESRCEIFLVRTTIKELRRKKFVDGPGHQHRSQLFVPQRNVTSCASFAIKEYDETMHSTLRKYVAGEPSECINVDLCNATPRANEASVDEK